MADRFWHETARTQHTKQARLRFNPISKDSFSQAGSLLITVETQSTSVTWGSSRLTPDDLIYTQSPLLFFLHQQHLLTVLSAGKDKTATWHPCHLHSERGRGWWFSCIDITFPHFLSQSLPLSEGFMEASCCFWSITLIIPWWAHRGVEHRTGSSVSVKCPILLWCFSISGAVSRPSCGFFTVPWQNCESYVLTK